MQIIIYGNGTMAKVLYSYARKSSNICGFTVDDSCIKENEKTFCGLPLVPFSAVQDVFSPSKYKMIISIGFIDMNELREKKYLEVKQKGYSFSSFIHESVYLHDGVVIEENCIILDFVSIHPDSQIGHSTFISSNVNIGHDCIVKPGNWINAGVSIAGKCEIGRGCFFGVNSSLANGVKIGERNFIAANTVVNKNTENNTVHLSEPSQIFKLESKKFLKFAKLIA